jgi:uncharacterized protein
MIRIGITREGERISQLTAQGHAGDAKAGDSIVCAAVSSLMYTAVNALESVAGIIPAIVKDDRKALISIRLAETDENRDAQIILRTIIQGLTDISGEYPKWVKITTLDGRTTT